mgnify:CR=1 FL=1|jgi:type IV secretion system protein TrbL
MKMPPILKTASYGLSCLALFVALPAYAKFSSFNLMDRILDKYQAETQKWIEAFTTAASWLFWTLAIISMIWTFGTMALRKADLGEFFAEFVRFTIFTGFFWWLLTSSVGSTLGTGFVTDIFSSLQQLAGKAGNIDNKYMSPSGMVDIGFKLLINVVKKSSILAPLNALIAIVVASIILVLLALIGVNILILMCSCWLLAYCGIFFLGFGGSRWTSDIAINYYKTVLAAAAQLMTMLLLVSIGKDFLSVNISKTTLLIFSKVNLTEMYVMLVAVITLYILTTKVPTMVSGIITGSNLGNTNTGAAGLAAAAAMAAPAVAAATGGAVGGYTSTQILSSLLSSSSEKTESTSDTSSGMFDSINDTSGSGGESSGITGSSPFAQAAGFGAALAATIDSATGDQGENNSLTDGRSQEGGASGDGAQNSNTSVNSDQSSSTSGGGDQGSGAMISDSSQGQADTGGFSSGGQQQMESIGASMEGQGGSDNSLSMSQAASMKSGASSSDVDSEVAAFRDRG